MTSRTPPPPLEITRLAPSPTGALHLGNARTFLINWAMARRGEWQIVLRIEDLDTPRVKPEAAAGIVSTLRWLGIDWDPSPVSTPGLGPAFQGVLVQTADLEPYRDAMRRLASRGLAYPCALSRTQIEHAASAPQEGASESRFPPELRPPTAGQTHDFDKAQREHIERTGEPANWRLVCPPGEVRVHDRIAGERGFDVSRIVGDFVLWTKRDQPSYQLAVVIDDHRQGVSQVVRGDDLLDSAARQLVLYRALELSNVPPGEPRYTHLPLVLGTDGRRLAKRHGDTRIETYRTRGVIPEAVIGLIAHWSIPNVARQPMGAADFAARFEPNTLPRSPVTLTPEDDRWLLSNARP